jgi:hypothetical protein
MGRVYGEWGQDRQDLPGEPLAQAPLLRRLELLVGDDAYARLLERGEDLLPQYVALLGEEALGVIVDAGELLLGGHPVGDGVGQLGGDLLLEPCDPDHEELVEVGLGDGDEPDPLQQGMPLVARLRQDPVVEGQPRELPVYVQ